MEENEKMIWYEVAVDVVPDKKNIRHNLFYVSVSRWEEWEENGNARFNYNPFEGKYVNRRDYFEKTKGRDDINHIIVADTIIDKTMALELEEYLVKGFRSCEGEHGFNTINEEAGE